MCSMIYGYSFRSMKCIPLISSGYSYPFLLADDLEPWLKWAYYVSPMSYGQNAIVMNEFLDKRWSSVSFSLLYQ